MPATKREQKMCHAVALETEHRQNECVVGRAEDVLELALVSPSCFRSLGGPVPPAQPALHTSNLFFKVQEGRTRSSDTFI